MERKYKDNSKEAKTCIKERSNAALASASASACFCEPNSNIFIIFFPLLVFIKEGKKNEETNKEKGANAM